MKLFNETNKNKLAALAQKKILLWLVGGVVVLVLISNVFVSHPKQEEKTKNPTPALTGIVEGSDLANGAHQAAINQVEGQITELQKELKASQDAMVAMQKSVSTSLDSNKKISEDIKNQIHDLANTKTQNKGLGQNPQNFQSPNITTTNFSYGTESQTEDKNPDNYVPPGTFAKAVLLSGADTNAGVNGQTDTLPINMRVLDDGTLPNGKHSSLKSCFVTAAAYGDASSERGQIRLQRLSCVRDGGHILDIPVEGTISDMGGNDGIRGNVVMRNGRLLWNAGFSGFLSGIGGAMQQSMTTQSVSPLGSTSTIPSGKVFQYGAYGGANTALDKLAGYYIKLADLYHPIVQIHAGSNVDIVFLKGFSLNTEKQQSVDQVKATTENTVAPIGSQPSPLTLTPEQVQKLNSAFPTKEEPSIQPQTDTPNLQNKDIQEIAQSKEAK